jgi:hypothetical protein
MAFGFPSLAEQKLNAGRLFVRTSNRVSVNLSFKPNQMGGLRGQEAVEKAHKLITNIEGSSDSHINLFGTLIAPRDIITVTWED